METLADWKNLEGKITRHLGIGLLRCLQIGPKMWGKYGENLENFVGILQTPTQRLRKIGEIHLKERSMSDLLATRPNTTIDLKRLEDKKISKKIFQRGMRLKAEGKARRNSLYPWRFMVSGDKTDSGITAYQVDIAEHTCSCGWFINTESTCKHLIAALLIFMESQVNSATS